MKRHLATLVLVALTAPALAEPAPEHPAISIMPDATRPRLRDVLVPMKHPQASQPTAVVNTHTLFLNNCMPSGCPVKTGSPNALTDTSDIPSRASTMTAYSYGQTSWNSVMSCMKNVMSRFNITVTDQRPTGNYFEVMVAGSPGDLGLSNDIGGIADFNCSSPGECNGSYVSNDLVFAFANIWQGSVNDICATAAQEIAHAWNLDHVVDASDPMTYNNYTGIRQYHDNETCGSDCVSGRSPFGLTCSGSNDTTATHACMGTGTATQNEVQVITALFGASNATPPTVAITSPTDGSGVATGFSVDVTCTDSAGVSEVDLAVDGTMTASLTAAPYKFTTSSSMSNGTHQLAATCSGTDGGQATASATVTVGLTCTSPQDCPDSTDTCADGTCIPGSSAPGGLGTTCTSNTDCQSGSCGTDGTSKYCVVPCDPAMNECPSGFGCEAAGTSGVCWPGADSGGTGGCNTGDNGGPVVIGLGLAVLVFVRRRR